MSERACQEQSADNSTGYRGKYDGDSWAADLGKTHSGSFGQVGNTDGVMLTAIFFPKGWSG
ncbi:hypothetical protein BFN67_17010 [Pseudaminobacter manganicus]|uniref:Uncharacterized protein n=1 Tax=Manganibacter manganicus TaxID=1873176 RepID=A0A1V8RRA8_9HYPH|nr:hypothetical protein BFN67_17010 [Pseudaminobacter manganicus]